MGFLDKLASEVEKGLLRTAQVTAKGVEITNHDPGQRATLRKGIAAIDDMIKEVDQRQAKK